jgi:hypothetical protein
LSGVLALLQCIGQAVLIDVAIAVLKTIAFHVTQSYPRHLYAQRSSSLFPVPATGIVARIHEELTL